ncbi:MAG: hypothetical protein CMH94_07165 [Oceanicaulis sp.]|uniref:Uncharacterized protein n=1 Tax=Maricaulis virginensis TaxID=144022 RepID=A0A9W6MQ96_9PROT|nr:hypothetical protein [Maricaulis virginensis]MAZ92245.1 hypothetical protein [Maricaulis sp.]MBI75366.1 hypothetical protein [Oceanicaulis sp.]GLK53741.1 hypothetical protein GCM10017621_32490 [Maricaulis virginensis]
MFGIKTIAAALALSTVGSISMAGAAQADTWVLNAAACPDLREDRRDRRHYDGRRDRREDFRDRRVIDCPPRAWRYEAGRWDRHYGHPRYERSRYASPGLVYRSRDGGFYVADRYGRRQWIDVRIEYPRGRHYDRPHGRPYRGY